ncbi:hypothetical protein PCASD_11702 [Puccinia coronata f. sp. avenae]|uniref:Uncharacterized protein n=1 Tax=Puccinia coronata f. sp. avenae TaxID=200324 RepID=A0A2N5UME0_9BASI|nr:hypothetical protein PCASD_11702 [Puccinia coronata f. sp. avenae]
MQTDVCRNSSDRSVRRVLTCRTDPPDESDLSNLPVRRVTLVRLALVGRTCPTSEHVGQLVRPDDPLDMSAQLVQTGRTSTSDIWGVRPLVRHGPPTGGIDHLSDYILRQLVGRACPSINLLNTPVQAVLNPPCWTSDWTSVSDRLGKALVGHAVNAGRVPALTGPTRPFEHRSNRCVQPVIGPACPTGSEKHRLSPAKPITG